ncbi:hypothetical protein AGMMS50293_21750 [Spirochaetia bacterium]|nr:hypothetical protein AGMMS50293_21750 [Spirochaetia bacterium]
MSINYEKICKDNLLEYGEGKKGYKQKLFDELNVERPHFIYELLQNAEDVDATTISFHLYNDRLEVFHNGLRNFNEQDVIGISGIFESSKDKSKKGKFGIGFKSIYLYTKSPEIYSGEESFIIEDFNFPKKIPNKDIKGKNLFIIKFNRDGTDKNKSFTEIKEKLLELGSKTLLFLDHLNCIEYYLNDKLECRYKKEPIEIKLKNCSKWHLIFEKDSSTKIFENWLIIARECPELAFDINGQKKIPLVQIGYKLGKDKDKNDVIINENDDLLVVYFPTEKRTGFNFLIQGPYNTTLSRDDIKKNDEWNNNLIKETSLLFIDSLKIIKELNLLSVSFLCLLPIRFSDFVSSPFKQIPEKLITAFNDYELLPTNDGNKKFSMSGNIKISRNESLRKLIDSVQLQEIFGNKYYWLTGEITSESGSTKDLYDYLKTNLGIDELVPTDFCKIITEENSTFLRRQKETWYPDYFEFLNGLPSHWREESGSYKAGFLRTKKFIPLEDGSIGAPFLNDGKTPQIFYPPHGETDLPIIKRSLLDYPQVKAFLKQLNFTEPDLSNEIIIGILQKYKIDGNTVDRDDNIRDIKTIIKYYKTKDDKKWQEILEHLKTIRIFQCILPNENHSYERASDSYIDAPFQRTGLLEIEGIHKKARISPDYLKFMKQDEKEIFTNILIDLNVMYKLTIERVSIICNSKFRKWRESDLNHKYVSGGIDIDYNIPFLEEYIKIKSPKISKLIWDVITNASKDVAKALYSENRMNPKSISSQLINVLKRKKWLIDSNGEFKKPEDVSIDTLADGFHYNESIILREIGFGFNSEKLGQDYQTKEAQAKSLGFSTLEEAETMVALMDNIKKLGEDPKNILDKYSLRLNPVDINFDDPIENNQVIEKIQEREMEDYQKKPVVTYTKKERSIRDYVSKITTQLLVDKYTHDDEMWCQICTSKMPFKNIDGTYYFEAVQLFDDYFTRETDAQYIALCPLCAAKYKYLIKKDTAVRFK